MLYTCLLDWPIEISNNYLGDIKVTIQNLHIIFHLLYKQIRDHSKNKMLHKCVSKIRLDLEYSNLAFNEHMPCKNAKKLRQNQITLGNLKFCLLSILHHTCLLNTKLECSWFNLIFDQFILLDNFTFSIPYCTTNLV